MGDRETLRARLYESYATTHLGAPDSRGAEPAFRAHILPHMPAERDADIADVGCGAGTLVKFLGERGYRNVRGVDASPEQVQVAQRAGVDGVEQGDLREYLAARANQLDVVIAMDVLEHFSQEEVLDVLDHIRGALRPGGRLILRTPNAGSLFAGRVRYWDFTHQLAFTAQSFSQVLATTGFESISVHPTTPPPHGLKSAVRWSIWRAMAGVCWLYLVAETGVPRGHVLTQNLVAVADRPYGGK